MIITVIGYIGDLIVSKSSLAVLVGCPSCYLPRMARYISSSAAQRFYSAVGKLEDSQAFYEDPALDILISQGHFRNARHVFELGCGTGRLAERLLAGPLPSDTCYIACDLSSKMVALAKSRLTRFGHRIEIFETDGDTVALFEDRKFDRIVTSYVLDLLPPDKIAAFLDAAACALLPGGCLCAVSIAPGKTFPSTAIMKMWKGINAFSPVLTGGCRPIDLGEILLSHGWNLVHASSISAWGITSQIVIAALPEQATRRFVTAY